MEPRSQARPPPRSPSAGCAERSHPRTAGHASRASSTGSMAPRQPGISPAAFDYGSPGAVIQLEHVSKGFAGGSNAVLDLSLEIPDGQTCVLIGPSGCGKTTTLRMINRLIDPDRGRVIVDGVDTHQVDPAALRLKMGYVIQQTGLFPHMTIGGNVPTVPRLWKWERT